MQETSSLDAIRRAIAEHLAYQSEWRGQKAEEYPEDDRNARAAADLAELAAQAEQLPAGNDNLRALDLLMDELEETDPYVFLSFHDALGRDVTSSLHVWWTLPGGVGVGRHHIRSMRFRGGSGGFRLCEAVRVRVGAEVVLTFCDA